MESQSIPYLDNEQIYVCSILEKWNKLKKIDGIERNKYLKYFKNPEATKKLSKYYSNIYGHLIEKFKETGIDILIAGSSVIGSFPPYDYQPNDLDFYVKHLNNKKIIEIDKKIREVFLESKIIIFRKLITITWWIFNPEMTQLHLTIQLNTFQIDSWSDVFIIYHSDFLCIGYETKTNKFVYFKERFNPIWLSNKPEYSWGSNILSFDVDNSFVNVVNKYNKRGIPIKMALKNKYLTKKFILDTYFKDIFDIKELIQTDEETQNEENSNQNDDYDDDELEFSSVDIIDLNIEIDPELYQRYNLDLLLGKNEDTLSSLLSSQNDNNLERINQDEVDVEKMNNDLIYINGEIPDTILNNMMDRIEEIYGFEIIFQSEDIIREFLKINNIILYDYISNCILDKQSPNYLMTWRYFYQIIRYKYNYNIYRLKDCYIDKFKMAYHKYFSVSSNINDLLYNITMPPLINLILFKHKYNDTFLELVNILNECDNDNNLNYELCPILFTKQSILVSGKCNHQFSLQSYIMSFGTKQTIINCPLCRAPLLQLKIIFYPLTTISKLES